MKELTAQLIELLGRERDLYGEILELSKRKQDVISGGGIDELDDLVKQEQVFLIRLGELERKRKSAVGSLADALQKKPDDLTLSDILPVCSPEQRETLELNRTELRGILEEQIQLNEINHRLIDSKLQMINFTVDMMSGAQATNNYGAAGEQQGRDGRSINIIDHKA